MFEKSRNFCTFLEEKFDWSSIRLVVELSVNLALADIRLGLITYV